MKHRRAYLVFPDKHGISPELIKASKLLSGLNISFSMQITSGMGMAGNANITVYNLNREDMGFLSTCAAKWEQQKALIQLYAGYSYDPEDNREDDIKCIFSGWVFTARPEGYPDLALKITCQTGVDWTKYILNVNKDNVTIMDLIDYTSSVTDYPVNMNDKLRKTNRILNKRLDNFSYSGSSWGLMQKIQEMIGSDFTANKDGVMLSTYNDQTFVYSPDSGLTSGNTLLISKDTGMIGVPHPVSGGVEVTMVLNTKINIGDKVRVVSERMPIINGDYFVVMFNHTGELRGKTWQTTIKCSPTQVAPLKVNEGSIIEGLGNGS
jgi:hypothetical protein